MRIPPLPKSVIQDSVISRGLPWTIEYALKPQMRISRPRGLPWSPVTPVVSCGLPWTGECSLKSKIRSSQPHGLPCSLVVSRGQVSGSPNPKSVVQDLVVSRGLWWSPVEAGEYSPKPKIRSSRPRGLPWSPVEAGKYSPKPKIRSSRSRGLPWCPVVSQDGVDR